MRDSWVNHHFSSQEAASTEKEIYISLLLISWLLLLFFFHNCIPVTLSVTFTFAAAISVFSTLCSCYFR